MQTYYIDFTGFCEIQATSPEEAEKIFWDKVYKNEPLPSNLYEIENIAEKPQ